MDYIRQIEQTNKRQMQALRPPHRKEVLKARESDIKGKVQNGCHVIVNHDYNVLLQN